MRDSRLFSLLAVAGLLSLGLLAERNRNAEESETVPVRIGIELPESSTNPHLAGLGAGSEFGLRIHRRLNGGRELAGTAVVGGKELDLDLAPGTYDVELCRRPAMAGYGEMPASPPLGTRTLVVHPDGRTEPARLIFP